MLAADVLIAEGQSRPVGGLTVLPASGRAVLTPDEILEPDLLLLLNLHPALLDEIKRHRLGRLSSALRFGIRPEADGGCTVAAGARAAGTFVASRAAG